MNRINLRHVSFYALAVPVILLSSLFSPVIPFDSPVFSYFRKLMFTVPLIYMISVFLAFRISETEIALTALSLGLLAISDFLLTLLPDDLACSDLVVRFFSLLPLILVFALSLYYLIPSKIGGFSTSFLKVISLLLPFIFFAVPEKFEHVLSGAFIPGIEVPWPAFAAAMLPPVAVFMTRDRRTGIFAPALMFSFIVILLPSVLSLDIRLSGLCGLFSSLIILHALYRVYWENSYIDELTGLFNRRALDEKFRRLRKRYILGMVDVDHFKKFNDTYGHDEGDNVLRLVARILGENFGSSAYRYGGEEFCVIFRNCDIDTAVGLMNEARSDVEVHGFSIRRSQKNRRKSGRKSGAKGVARVKLTVSAGCSAAEPGKDAFEVLKKADKALYKAKGGGRNRVEVL